MHEADKCCAQGVAKALTVINVYSARISPVIGPSEAQGTGKLEMLCRVEDHAGASHKAIEHFVLGILGENVRETIEFTGNDQSFSQGSTDTNTIFKGRNDAFSVAAKQPGAADAFIQYKEKTEGQN